MVEGDPERGGDLPKAIGWSRMHPWLPQLYLKTMSTSVEVIVLAAVSVTSAPLEGDLPHKYQVYWYLLIWVAA